ncbi:MULTISPECIES: hypothetical protein [unclassified Microcoleus]|uniref:hypothetical protein n=1 Tax=unclassified Microcoleus TaxID=2642155 RepID=UPI002FD33826
MPRWFNTAGPCQADIHYVLPPTLRLPGLERLIAQRNYFVIHAPRQVGKTTAMLALAKQLTDSGQYTAVIVSVEVGTPLSSDVNPWVQSKNGKGSLPQQGQNRPTKRWLEDYPRSLPVTLWCC